MNKAVAGLLSTVGLAPLAGLIYGYGQLHKRVDYLETKENKALIVVVEQISKELTEQNSNLNELNAHMHTQNTRNAVWDATWGNLPVEQPTIMSVPPAPVARAAVSLAVPEPEVLAEVEE